MRRRNQFLIALGVVLGLGLFILLAWSTGSASRLAQFHQLLVFLNFALALGFGLGLGLNDQTFPAATPG